ncbi:hypothetical protein F4826_001974 [Rahnella inusitata]|nr:hypothetical protein [Rahnella inusitata]
MKLHNETKPFFITESVAAEMIAAGYEFAPPGHARTTSLPEILAGLTDKELESWPSVVAKKEIERRKGRG